MLSNSFYEVQCSSCIGGLSVYNIILFFNFISANIPSHWQKNASFNCHILPFKCVIKSNYFNQLPNILQFRRFLFLFLLLFYLSLFAISSSKGKFCWIEKYKAHLNPHHFIVFLAHDVCAAANTLYIIHSQWMYETVTLYRYTHFKSTYIYDPLYITNKTMYQN